MSHEFEETYESGEVETFLVIDEVGETAETAVEGAIWAECPEPMPMWKLWWIANTRDVCNFLWVSAVLAAVACFLYF